MSDPKRNGLKQLFIISDQFLKWLSSAEWFFCWSQLPCLHSTRNLTRTGIPEMYSHSPVSLCSWPLLSHWSSLSFFMPQWLVPRVLFVPWGTNTHQASACIMLMSHWPNKSHGQTQSQYERIYARAWLQEPWITRATNEMTTIGSFCLHIFNWDHHVPSKQSLKPFIFLVSFSKFRSYCQWQNLY